MFRSTATAPPAELDDVVDPASLVPLSILELDIPSPPTGWLIELDRRHIEVLDDDLGRLAITRSDARRLLWEHREAEAVRREAAERQREAIERRAIEADQEFRARLWQGMPADHMPAGVAPAQVMFAADRDAQPRRVSPLQEALANSGELTFHSLAATDDES
jgi:hypothetical protein